MKSKARQRMSTEGLLTDLHSTPQSRSLQQSTEHRTSHSHKAVSKACPPPWMSVRCTCTAESSIQDVPAIMCPLGLCGGEQAACGHSCAALEATWLHAKTHLCSSTSASGSATAVPAFSTMSIMSLTRMEAQTWGASSGLPPMSNEKPCTKGRTLLKLDAARIMVQALQSEPIISFRAKLGCRPDEVERWVVKGTATLQNVSEMQ